MKKLLTIVLLLEVSVSMAQSVIEVGDSVKLKASALLTAADSVKKQNVSKRDSALNKFNSTKDNFSGNYQNKSDSIETATIGKLDSSVSRLNQAIDSVNQLPALTATRYQQTVDSLYKNFQKKVLSQYTSPTDSVSVKVKNKVNSLETELDKRTHFLDSLTEHSGATTNLALADRLNLTLPSAEIINNKLPSIPASNLSIDKLNIPSLEKPSAPDVKIVTPSADLPAMEGLNEVSGKIGKVSEVATEASEYAKDVQNIKENGIKESEKLPELAEQQVMQLEQLKPVQGELAKAEVQKNALLESMTPPKNAEEMQREAWKVVQQKAVDHFTGKEEVLQKALDQVSEYKQKYETVGAVTDLKKRPANPLKHKQFMERLVPGIYLQYQRKGDYWIDLYPYVGYRVTQRFVTGLGWNHRIVRDGSNTFWKPENTIYGPRAYAEMRVYKGFIGYMQTEVQNTHVLENVGKSSELGDREWVWGMMTGLKTEYRITRWMKGTALIQYNIFDRKHKSPYADRLNSRMGFEFIMRK